MKTLSRDIISNAVFLCLNMLILHETDGSTQERFNIELLDPFTEGVFGNWGYWISVVLKAKGFSVGRTRPLIILDAVCREQASWAIWSQSGTTLTKAQFQLKSAWINIKMHLKWTWAQTRYSPDRLHISLFLLRCAFNLHLWIQLPTVFSGSGLRMSPYAHAAILTTELYQYLMHCCLMAQQPQLFSNVFLALLLEYRALWISAHHFCAWMMNDWSWIIEPFAFTVSLSKMNPTHRSVINSVCKGSYSLLINSWGILWGIHV